MDKDCLEGEKAVQRLALLPEKRLETIIVSAE